MDIGGIKMENGIIHAYLRIKEADFEQFLKTYFDENGNCLVAGIKKTMEERIEEMKSIKNRNEIKRTEKLKKSMTILKDLPEYQAIETQEGRDEAVSSIISSVQNDDVITERINIPVDLNVVYLDEEIIKSLISTGSYRINPKSTESFNTIHLDRTYYGLELENRRMMSPFISDQEKEKRIFLDNQKRQELIESFIEYKKNSSQHI